MTDPKETADLSSVPLSSVQPSAHLPQLEHISSLPPEERRVALAGWVTWLHANREPYRPAIERALERTLALLESVEQTSDEEEQLTQQFDDWLDSVRQVK